MNPTGAVGPRRVAKLVVMVLVICLLFTPIILRADLVDELTERYRSVSGIQGDFTQKLKSRQGYGEKTYTGRYRYSVEDGLHWNIFKPVEGTLTIDSAGNVETAGELGGLSVLKKRTVGRLIVAMVAMNRKVLGRYYHLSKQPSEVGFHLQLEAKQGWETQAGSVAIRGGQWVENVRMRFPDGRSMELLLARDQ